MHVKNIEEENYENQNTSSKEEAQNVTVYRSKL